MYIYFVTYIQLERHRPKAIKTGYGQVSSPSISAVAGPWRYITHAQPFTDTDNAFRYSKRSKNRRQEKQNMRVGAWVSKEAITQTMSWHVWCHDAPKQRVLVSWCMETGIPDGCVSGSRWATQNYIHTYPSGDGWRVYRIDDMTLQYWLGIQSHQFRHYVRDCKRSTWFVLWEDGYGNDQKGISGIT